ncbi:MAG: hypothetical protein IKV60_01065 [Rikenellaceae bacterium]|nr:hypothetical protein [Rikenellaceae bacterium]
MKLRLLSLAVMLVSASAAFAQITPEQLAKRERRKNLTVKEWNTDTKAKTKWLDHLTVYDDQGRKVEEIEFSNYGQVERVTCEYDETTGKVSKEIVYDDRNKPSRIRKYEYNADGTKRKQYNYLPNGKLYSVKVFEYIFSDSE